MTQPTTTPPRPRNPRGQGERLRDDILAAADALLAATGDPSTLSLRGVAKQVGIAATSMYLHFPDVTDLKIAVVQRAYAELDAARDRASQARTDPVAALLARLHAYALFALANPGRYRLMFGPELPISLAYTGDQAADAHAPGQRALRSLADSLSRCQQAGLAPPEDDPQQSALFIWTALHGLLLLRMDRPHFPWPPLAAMVQEMALRLARCAAPDEQPTSTT